MLFFWFDGLGWKGFRNPLEYSDLWDLNDEDKSEVLATPFEKSWKESIEKGKSKTSNELTSILPCLIKLFGPSFLFGAFMKLVNDLLGFFAPFLLEYVKYLEREFLIRKYVFFS
jgi:ATP-binding cassette subfamily C (CFTR/MRP) protein 1